MNTKLTLRLDRNLIRSAKQYAGNSGKSVSQLVADFFYLIEKKSPRTSEPLTPVVQSLKGALKAAELDESDYKKYLEEKFL